MDIKTNSSLLNKTFLTGNFKKICMCDDKISYRLPKNYNKHNKSTIANPKNLKRIKQHY